MALSIKVIAAYKESTNSIVQVEKEARVALRTHAIAFGLRVREQALKLMEKDKRKSLKLGDVVTAVSYCLAQDFTTIQIDAFIDAIFGSSVPYSVEKNDAGGKVVTYANFTNEQTSHLFVNQNGHMQINHKNTLRISEIERLLATSRKAHRTANAFLAICLDQYVQNLLTAAESRVTQDKKKRIKVEHITVPSPSPELAAALAAFVAESSKKGADDDDTEVPAEDAKGPAEDAKVPAEDAKVPAEDAKVPAEDAKVPAAVESETKPAATEKKKKTSAAAVEAAPAETVKVAAAVEVAAVVETTEAAPPAKKARTKKVAEQK